MARFFLTRSPPFVISRSHLSTLANSSSVSEEKSQITPTAQPTVSTEYKTYPFFIHRTKNKTLPVYTDYKNGRTRTLTIIRKIEGDIDALVSQLKADFPKVPSSTFISKPHLQQVVIKGLVREEIMVWLAQKGF